MARLNHKWVKDKDFKIAKYSSTFAKYTCSRCGCVKHSNSYKREDGGRRYEDHFTRDGRSFGYNPECIDWDDNTLD